MLKLVEVLCCGAIVVRADRAAVSSIDKVGVIYLELIRNRGGTNRILLVKFKVHAEVGSDPLSISRWIKSDAPRIGELVGSIFSLEFKFLTTAETVMLGKAMVFLQVLFQIGNLGRSPSSACMILTVRRLSAEDSAVMFVERACKWTRNWWFRLQKDPVSSSFAGITIVLVAVGFQRPLPRPVRFVCTKNARSQL